METLDIINVVIRILIVIACIVGLTFAYQIAGRMVKSVFGVTAIYLLLGFFTIIIGKGLGAYWTINGTPESAGVGIWQLIISGVGLIFFLLGMVTMYAFGKKRGGI